MDILLILLILLACILIFVVSKVAKLHKTINRQANQIEALDILLNDVNATVMHSVDEINNKSQNHEQRVDEIDQVSRQLEHRIKAHKGEIEKLAQQIESIQAQEPEDRFYSRALKLAKLGSSVDEIMSECEIPRAEAEMLVAVHKQQNS